MSAEKKSDKPLIASVSVGLGDPPTVAEQERPSFRIVVIAEASPDAYHGVADGAGGLVRVQRDVDASMAALEMRLVVDLDVPLVDGAHERVEIPVDSLRVFRPAGLVERVPALTALVEARRAIGSAPGSDDAKAARARALAAAPAAMRGALSELLEPSAPAPQKTTSSSRSAIDDLFDRVGVGNDDAPSAVAAVARTAVNTSDETLPGRTSRIEAALTRALDALLAHQDLRRLERVWRSIALLREHAGDAVVVDLVAIAPHASAEALAAVAEHAEATGEAVDLVVLDQCIDTTPTDVERLQACAEQAERMHAPLIASTVATALGAEDLASLARSQRRLGSPGDARSVPLHAFMARDVARWVCLALNGPLLRGPYQTTVSGVRFAQRGDGFVHALPAFGVAALVAAAFSRDAWPAPHDGPRHGMLANLAVRQEGDALASALEHPMALEAQKAAARAGIAVFGGAEGRDQAILAFVPMAFRGAALATGGDPAAPLTLSDQLLIGRVASLLDGLAREIPKGTAGSVVQEVALSILASAFPEGDRPPVSAASDGGTVTVRVDARGWRGVTIGDLELSAPLSG